jgi:RNA polymerase-binding protein DksA
MDKKTIEKIKKELLSRRQQIVEDLKNTAQNRDIKKGEMRAKFPQFGDKDEENALEVSEYSTNLATEKVLESALRDIDNALERITKGSYGICKYCGKDIGEKRLLARPTASACVACKSKLQKGL